MYRLEQQIVRLRLWLVRGVRPERTVQIRVRVRADGRPCRGRDVVFLALPFALAVALRRAAMLSGASLPVVAWHRRHGLHVGACDAVLAGLCRAWPCDADGGREDGSRDGDEDLS